MSINKLLSSIFINILIIYFIAKYIPGLDFFINFQEPSLEVYLMVGAIFWGIDVILKRIVKILSLPINILTLGIFGVVINVAFLYLFQYIMNTYIQSIATVQLGNIVQVLILSILIYIGNLLLKKL